MVIPHISGTDGKSEYGRKIFYRLQLLWRVDFGGLAARGR